MHFRRKIKLLQFKLKLQTTLKDASQEELRLILEETRKEIDKRSRKKK